MSYIVWCMIGVVVALLFGASARRRAYRPNANASVLAGAFGGLVGGVIGDGVPHAIARQITLLSLAGAMVGALIFCWAVRGRAEDAGP